MNSFIATHLQGVSRTYAILIPMLPRPLDEVVGVAYLVMRIVDTVEDDSQLDTAERLAYLDDLEGALRGDPDAAARLTQPRGDTAPEEALMQAAPEVFARVAALEEAYRIAVCDCAFGMVRGVRKLIARAAERGHPYPAIYGAEELREYCYYVAGVVGEMLCAMMARYLKLPALLRLRELAVELGIGLQLVNILKDCVKDSQHGRRYLPVTREGTVAPAEVLRAVLSEARQSLQRGVEFVLALPPAARELRSFCGLPIAWGALTLAKVEREPSRAKIGRGAVRETIAAFGKLAGDDHALRDWFHKLLGGDRAGVDVVIGEA